MRIKRKILNFLVLLLFFLQSYSQDLTNIQSNSLLLSFDYLNNTNTFGIFVSEAIQPNYSPSISFLSKYNFDLGFTTFIVGNSDTSFSEPTYEYDFFAAYNFYINDKLLIYPSYTHIEYSKNSYTLRSVFSDIIQLDLYAYLKWYSAGLTTSGMFGNKNMFYASLQQAVELNIDDLLFKNSLLTIQLEVDVNFSDRNFYNELIYSSWDRTDQASWIRSLQPEIFREYTQIRRNNPTLANYYLTEELNNLAENSFQREYNLSSVNVLLPIYYSVKNLMFNITIMGVFPTYSNDFFSSDPQLIYNVGMAYSFNW